MVVGDASETLDPFLEVHHALPESVLVLHQPHLGFSGDDALDGFGGFPQGELVVVKLFGETLVRGLLDFDDLALEKFAGGRPSVRFDKLRHRRIL